MARNKIFRRYAVPLLAVLVLMLAATSAYFYNKSKLSTRPNAKEAAELAREVGKLMVLPKDEVPTIATVSDPQALANQPFFDGAKIGDKVLIYTAAKKAILYDRRARKIINVAPLNIDIGAAANKSTGSTAPATQ